MNNVVTTKQWTKREGYAGISSFPKEVMGFVRPKSEKLAGQSFIFHLSDHRILKYQFNDIQSLSVEVVEGNSQYNADKVTYRAFEGAANIFLVSHGYSDYARRKTTLVIDLNRHQVVLIDSQLPEIGADINVVQDIQSTGYIGERTAPGEIIAPPFPTSLVGRRIAVNYNNEYIYEAVFLSEHHVAWHGIKGNAGLADVEEYTATQFAPGVICVHWSENREPLSAVMLMNFNDGKINGNMFGYDPDVDQILDVALGSELLDPAELGVQCRGVTDTSQDLVLQRNKDVILRSHLEVWNQAKYELIETLYDQNFGCHFICGIEAKGRAEMQKFIIAHREAFPDWTERVVDIFAEGDRVVTRYLSTGTHLGNFQGIEPTGKAVTVNEVSIYCVRNGQILEQWGFPDGLSVVQQLEG